jgi:AraC-like DNA-binding protein
MDASPDPLFRYPAIRTSSVEEFESELVGIYGATGFDLPDPKSLRGRGNFIQLSDIALGFGACGTSTTIFFGEGDFARLQLPLRGHGATRCGKEVTQVSAGRPSLTSPGRPSMLDYGDDFEQLFVRVGSGAIERKLAVLLGRSIGREFEFELAEFAGPAMMSGLRHLIDLLVEQLDDEHSRLAPVALRELEQAVILQLLFASRHNFSALLAREPLDTTPVHVRRVEAFIEANWSRPITIEALAETAGVSARTLFRAFERVRGCSPMAFARQVRLERARNLLLKPEETASVTGIALLCGFSSLGHFASAYRIRFGELPSQTLHRSRFRA